MVLGITLGVAGLLFLALLLILVPWAVSAMTRGPLTARIARHHRQEDILLRDLMANNFGLQSRGVIQLRGNGALVLTAAELHFFMLVPEEEFRIPLGAIREVSLVRAHLGKTVGRQLLKIRFTREGAEDAVAWYVRDPEAWRLKLTELTGAK
jgi:hypothetical protein